jgi:hypothetical protein
MPAIRLQIAASGFESGAVVEADKATADNLVMHGFATRAEKDATAIGTLETASADLSVENAALPTPRGRKPKAS